MTVTNKMIFSELESINKLCTTYQVNTSSVKDTMNIKQNINYHLSAVSMMANSKIIQSNFQLDGLRNRVTELWMKLLDTSPFSTLEVISLTGDIRKYFVCNPLDMPKKASSGIGSLSKIPQVVLLQCFSFLRFQDVISLFSVSKEWEQISKDDVIWEVFCSQIESLDKTLDSDSAFTAFSSVHIRFFKTLYLQVQGISLADNASSSVERACYMLKELRCNISEDSEKFDSEHPILREIKSVTELPVSQHLPHSSYNWIWKKFEHITSIYTNRIKNLVVPIEFQNFKILKLDIRNSSFKIFPVNFNLMQLKECKLHNCEVDVLSDSIFLASNLNKLEVINCPVKKISDKISLLQRLTLLNFQNSELEELPKSIWELSNLRELNLQNNRLKNFPEPMSVRNLFLNISENLFEEIPNGVWLQRKIDISNNPLKVLPDFRRINYNHGLTITISENLRGFFKISISNGLRIVALNESANIVEAMKANRSKKK